MKKSVLFVNDEMTMGGVARILNTFLKYIDRNKYDVDLLVLHKRGELLEEVPEGVNIIEGTNFFKTIDIPLKQCKGINLFNKLRLLFYMKTGLIKDKIKTERKKILNKQYDIEFSAKEGFCTIFTAYGDSKKKINWIQTDYKKENYSKNNMHLMKEALKKIDINIACSIVAKDSYQEIFNVNNICIINNLMDIDRVKELSAIDNAKKESDNKIKLVTVARFHKQKGLDRLIRAYSKLKENCHLTIIGDGDLRKELYSLAKENDCFDDIDWLGIMNNPYPVIKKSDIFVMSSIYEGYPTITIESLLCGTPVLTTLVAGVEEQINESNGWIVENSEDALFRKLNELVDRKEEIETKKANIINYKYDNNSILRKYYQIFDS